MDYYFSKFSKRFPDKNADDYIIFIKKQNFFESLLIPIEQLIIFLRNECVLGYIRISPIGKMQEPTLCPEIKFQKTTRKYEINIVGKSTYEGTYTLVKGFKMSDKALISKKLLGG